MNKSKSIFFFFSFILLFSYSVKSQNVDSLIVLLDSKDKNEKLQTYLDIAIADLLTNPKETIKYAGQGLELATKEDNIYYKGSFFGIIGFAYYVMSDIESAIDYTQKSINSLMKTDSLLQLSKAYLTLGAIYKKTGDYQKALEYNRLGLNIHKKKNNQKGIALSYLNLGTVYQTKGDYTLAIDNYLKSMKYYENDKNHRNYYILQMSIGLLYNELDEYDKALEYLLRCLGIIEKTSNKADIASCYSNIGIVYKNLEDLDNAYEFYIKAKKIAEDLDNKFLLGKIYNNMGKVCAERANFIEAINYYKLSLDIKKKSNDSTGIAVCCNNIGSVYGKTSEHQLALDYLRKAEDISIQKQLELKLLDTYQAYVEVYKNMKDYEKAFKYQTQYYAIKDEIFNSEKHKQISELQTKYETEKKEKEIQILNQKNDIKDLKIKKQNYLRIILLIALIFLIIISVIGYSRYLIKKRANLLLNKQKQKLDDYNEELNVANENLQDANFNLEELNNTKDKFFSIISHDLKNPLNVLYATTDVLNKNLETFSPEKTSIYLQNMNKSSKNIISLLDNLLEWSQIQTGSLEWNPVSFDLFDIVSQNILILSEIANNKEIKLESEIKKNAFVFADKNMISTVIRNLLSNAIKFTPRNGRIRIYATENIDKITVSVSDTGIGIPENELKNLFKIDTKYKQPGTENEKGTGLGLILCKEFVEKNGGEISVQSQIDTGSVFTFTVKTK